MRPIRHLFAPVLVLATACGGGGGDDTPATLYERMGGEAGVRALVDDIVTRVSADERINGYFRNVSVDLEQMADCMALQIGAATGGPQTYPSGACRDMQAAHEGLGVSSQDFDDFAAAVVAAVNATDLPAADRTELLGVFTSHQAAVVEDESNDATVYQRVGRKPAISTVVTAFEARVTADPQINAFFSGVYDITRLHNCLTRLVCSIDGPCHYGEETPAEFPGLTLQFPCRDMGSSHYGLHAAGDPGATITVEHFDRIVFHMTETLDAAGVAPADRDAIVTALAPLCPMIVAGGAGCP
jgi:hemoglobin